ncbi:MAG: tetratricopeptide repeat protein [Promethearchaeota archaeon]
MDQAYFSQQKEKGLLLSSQGKYKEADDLFLQLYREAKKLSQKVCMSDILYERGWNFYVAHQLQRAREIFENLARFSKSFYPRGMIKALTGQGLVDLAQGKLETALDYFQRCLNLSKMRGEPLGESYANIGIVYRAMGKFKDALQYLSLAKDIYRHEETIEAQINAGRIIQHMAGIHIDRGEWEKALKLTETHVQLREEFSPNLLGLALLDLARCHKAIGQRNEADNIINRAIKHEESLGVENVRPLLFLACMYIEDGMIKEAKTVLEKAEEVAARNASEPEGILCKIMRGKYIEKVSEITPSIDEKDHERAYNLYQQALEKAQELGLLKEILLANLELARLDIITGDFEEVEVFLKAVQEPAYQHNLIPTQIKALVLRSLNLSAQFNFPKALILLETAKETAIETDMGSIIPKIKKVLDQISEALQVAERYNSISDFQNSTEGRKHKEAALKQFDAYIDTLREKL